MISTIYHPTGMPERLLLLLHSQSSKVVSNGNLHLSMLTFNLRLCLEIRILDKILDLR